MTLDLGPREPPGVLRKSEPDSSFHDVVDDEFEPSEVEVESVGSVGPEGESDGVGAVVVEDAFGDGEDELRGREGGEETKRRVRKEEKGSLRGHGT